jgi:hypothetical protein
MAASSSSLAAGSSARALVRLADCRLCFAGRFAGFSQQSFRTRLGQHFSEVVDAAVTHLVATPDEFHKRSLKIKKALEHGIPIVGIGFYQALVDGEAIDADDFPPTSKRGPPSWRVGEEETPPSKLQRGPGAPSTSSVSSLLHESSLAAQIPPGMTINSQRLEEALDYSPVFVNRHRELWEIFQKNANNNLIILNSPEKVIPQMYSMPIVYACQHFGAGKTTLGREFANQLRTNPAVEQYFRQQPEFSKYAAEFQRFKDHGGKTIELSLRDTTSPLRICFNLPDLFVTTTLVTHLLSEWSESDAPIVLHFDEVQTVEQIAEIRLFVTVMWTVLSKNYVMTRTMPRIYFYVSGKQANPFATLGTHGPRSPCGSHFLILDALTTHHINTIWRNLQDEQRLINIPVDESLRPKVLEEIALVTGGAPRLVILTLRALSLYCQQSLRIQSESQVGPLFSNILEQLSQQQVLKLNFDLESVENDQATRDVVPAFCLFSVLAQMRIPLKPDQVINLRHQQQPLHRWLCRLPFYLRRCDGDANLAPSCSSAAGTNGFFYLVLPRFYSYMAARTFASLPLPAFLDSSRAFPATEAWRVWEHLPSMLIARKAAALAATGSSEKLTWAKALPELFAQSTFADAIPFEFNDPLCQVNVLPTGTDFRNPQLVAEMFHKYADQNVVFPPDKAPAPDFFYLIKHFLACFASFQFQSKLFSKQAFTPAMLRDELAKLIQHPSLTRTVFVVICTNYAPVINGLFSSAGGTIVMSTGSYSFHSGRKGPLLHRVETPSGQVASTSSRTPSSHTVVTVPADTEVVLVSPLLLRQWMGADLYDKVLQLGQRSQPENNNFSQVITTLDEVLRDSASTAGKPLSLDQMLAQGLISSEQWAKEREREREREEREREREREEREREREREREEREREREREEREREEREKKRQTYHHLLADPATPESMKDTIRLKLLEL